MKLLTLKEISAIYGQSYWFWHNLIKSGGVPHIQINDGGKILVDETDIEKWKKKNKKTNTY